MKKPILAILGFILLMMMVTIPISSHEGHGILAQATYNVTQSSEMETQWYDENFQFVSNYTINEGSTITVEFYEINQSDVNINLFLGNQGYQNVSDNLAATNLILNHYELPGRFGFLANTSWNKLENDLTEVVDEISVNKEENEYFDTTLATISFNYNFSGQSTYLVYERSTGLLLEANTGFGDSQLSFVINQTDLEGMTKINSENVGLDLPITMLTVISVSITCNKLRRYLTKSEKLNQY